MKKRLSKMDIWVLAVVLALIAGVFVRGRLVRRMPGTERYTYQMELSDVEGSTTFSNDPPPPYTPGIQLKLRSSFALLLYAKLSGKSIRKYRFWRIFHRLYRLVQCRCKFL